MEDQVKVMEAQTYYSWIEHFGSCEQIRIRGGERTPMNLPSGLLLGICGLTAIHSRTEPGWTQKVGTRLTFDDLPSIQRDDLSTAEDSRAPVRDENGSVG